VFLLEEFGKYLATLFTDDPVWNRLGTRFQEKERKKLCYFVFNVSRLKNK